MSSTGIGTSPISAPPKQIRFVNNEGQPPAKRRRINAACRTCRKRKTRCDGKRPFCSTCTENGHQCLGFADVGEGKKERKGSDSNRNAAHNHDEYEDDGKSPETQTESSQQVLRTSSLELRRSEMQSYFSHLPRSPTEIEDAKRAGTVSNFAGNYTDAEVFSEDESSPLGRSAPVRTDSRRVPYFRYFGPTAIVPGFKQMVVSVREHRRSTGAVSSVASAGSTGYGGGGSLHGGNLSQAGTEPRSTMDLPIYDQSDPLPVNRLIIHLVETFFAHLGCNYPFLRQKSFTQGVEERSVKAVLVDAVCALAARFSDHPLLTAPHDPSYPKSDYGQVFAQRAKASVVETFPCPTVAAVQACLLLAYESFGSNQDSALWMYLGCAIRMAVDLGLQKLDGVNHQDQKDLGYHRSSTGNDPVDPPPLISVQERMEIEQGRMDTLWAIFMLDRVISSGTGRPVTMRNEDFELAFPAITASTKSGWPNPFPALIQIIHLYGRVSDLLNNIKDVKDVTRKKIEGLASMEKDLTQLYQKLDKRLNFSASNFQHYCKTGEGTNFILVHFWFHTLIMLLHQPTLMHSFEGQILSLLPNSRELSMSSAKTIADILAFAELIDPRSFIGNPFTSQPIYIAACAFLMESAAHTRSHPASRDITPPGQGSKIMPNRDDSSGQKQKHSLLASAANQNYQRCYKALQQIETYWAGTRYILVALDQKAKGIWDPETFTEQEYEATKTKHEIMPILRRKLPLAKSKNPNSRFADLVRSPLMEAGPPNIGSSQAIGWSLAGTTNSSNSNLTFMYQNLNEDQVQHHLPPPQVAGNMIYDPIRSSLPESTPGSNSASNFQKKYQTSHQQQARHHSQPILPKYSHMVSDTATTSDAEILLGLQNSPFPKAPSSQHSFDQGHISPPGTRYDSPNGYDFPQSSPNMFPAGSSGYMSFEGVGDMMMESQEIDMSSLGDDMIPWLEYLPPDVLSFFDNGNTMEIPAGGSVSGDVDLGDA